MRMEEVDYEIVTKQQPSADVKASYANATVDDSISSQYETLSTSAQNDAAVTDVYQQLENN